MSFRQTCFKFFLNNFISNFFIRSFGLEKVIYHRTNPYLNFKVDPKSTTQENAGYSDRPEINEVIEKSKEQLQHAVKELCKQESTILDIGCGPGMYLQLFRNKKYTLFATDLNSTMIEASKKIVPEANFFCGNFLDLTFPRRFNFIYCIGMLVYIPRTSIKHFIHKLYSSLEDGGILYLNYPHALSFSDTLYHDLTYINYSPSFIDKIVRPYFDILKHEHAFDGRKIGSYDKQPYKSLNPATDRTYKNSYLLIAKKRT
jgi:SAM-dependent methyltransferase